MAWHIFCDFDNTISLADCTDVILEAYAASEWHDIETEWEAGKIGSRECMQQQIALLQATPFQMDQLIDQIEIDPYFIRFVEYCEAKKLPLTIVSDGLDYVIQRILARYQLGHLPVIAGNFSQRNNQWQLATPYAVPTCAARAVTCKCQVVQQCQRAQQIIYIGDGRSDFCVSSQKADVVLAKRSLLTHCQTNQLRHFAFENFADVQAIITQLTAQSPMRVVIPPSMEKSHANCA